LVHKLFDGELYTIGISDEARVRWWMEGDLNEILESRKQGLKLSFRGEVIDFEVKETTSSQVKRPDSDGSLS
jgi:hypothetical protein